MRNVTMEHTGTVVAQLGMALQLGRVATIAAAPDRVAVWQDGELRAQWPDSTATVRRGETEERRTPLWAVVVGLLTLPLFGLGLLLLFFRTTVRTTRTTVLVGGLPMLCLEEVGLIRSQVRLQRLQPALAA